MYVFPQIGPTALSTLFYDSLNHVSLHDFPKDAAEDIGGKCHPKADLRSTGKDLYI